MLLDESQQLGVDRRPDRAPRRLAALEGVQVGPRARALVGLDHHRSLARGVEVHELVAAFPRILAHELVANALLSQDQADLARERTERELEQLPHGWGSY